MSLLLKRHEVIRLLQESGLTYRQARRAIETGAVPKARHRLHSQARWWPEEVRAFDCVAFLQSLNHPACGEQGTSSKSAPPASSRRASIPVS